MPFGIARFYLDQILGSLAFFASYSEVLNCQKFCLGEILGFLALICSKLE